MTGAREDANAELRRVVNEILGSTTARPDLREEGYDQLLHLERRMAGAGAIDAATKLIKIAYDIGRLAL
jgi:hypothetical protein